jgi:hypothetical protein
MKLAELVPDRLRGVATVYDDVARTIIAGPGFSLTLKVFTDPSKICTIRGAEKQTLGRWIAGPVLQAQVTLGETRNGLPLGGRTLAAVYVPVTGEQVTSDNIITLMETLLLSISEKDLASCPGLHTLRWRQPDDADVNPSGTRSTPSVGLLRR